MGLGHLHLPDQPEVGMSGSRLFRASTRRGNYENDFSRDPWGWIMAEWQRIQEGAYEYFVEDYSIYDPVAALNSGRP